MLNRNPSACTAAQQSTKCLLLFRPAQFLAILMLAAVFLSSCNEPQQPQLIDEKKNVTGISMNNPDYQIVIVDSCEYVLYKRQETHDYSGAFTSGFCHKGNCLFCKIRQSSK
jgi:hypothetical protein